MNKYIVLVLMILAGCKPVPVPEEGLNDISIDVHAVNEVADSSAVVAKEEFGESLLWLEPLARCGKKQVSTVHWSKEAVASGEVSIELGDDSSSIFARVGSAGEKKTGAWARPGLSVSLRGANGKIIARQIFNTKNKCPEVVK